MDSYQTITNTTYETQHQDHVPDFDSLSFHLEVLSSLFLLSSTPRPSLRKSLAPHVQHIFPCGPPSISCLSSSLSSISTSTNSRDQLRSRSSFFTLLSNVKLRDSQDLTNLVFADSYSYGHAFTATSTKPLSRTQVIVFIVMSSPTQSAKGGSNPITPPSARPITPTKSAGTNHSFKTPKLSPRVPTSPMRYFSEEVRTTDGICPTLVITRGHRESTHFEDYCSTDPERDQLKYTEKLELLKKEVQIAGMLREINSINDRIHEMQRIFEPANAHLERLQQAYQDIVAVHQSKLQLIEQTKATSNVPNGTQDLSRAAIIDAHKAKTKVAKLEFEAMEIEIEVLEAYDLFEAEKSAMETKFADFKAFQVTLEKKSVAVAGLKDDYEQSNIAWIAKYKDGESTAAPATDVTVHDALGSLKQVSEENTTLQKKVLELSAEKGAAADEVHVLNQRVMALAAAEAKIQAQAQELAALTAFVDRTKKDVEEMKKSAKTKYVDVKSAIHVKALEDKIEIMKPIYRLGRSMRYRNNYSLLRTKCSDQNININLDKYEDGYSAYFGGNVLADSTMYHAGFDDEDTHGRDFNNFEILHYGVPANVVWELRNDFKILADVLDMASDMKAFISKSEKTDDEFGTIEFKEQFDKVLPRIFPSYKTLAITTDEQFKNDPGLVDAYEEMSRIASVTAAKNYVERRKGVEDSWDQPWENAWMEFEDVLYEANSLCMC
ncbi:uncharacterized protein RSE6_11581 [Rhynchosporium secalis]|uniref:Uncharacterized protein n=1 Tax=Rhynchosporium secalis TaxID=38038 RepID=A0A1E1MNA2_RHYSE|nr:uncharacterized protein RSE6_11581 [Rhynchosporium secalis]